MAGSKTRPGFSGGDEPPPSNPEEALSPHAARTMIGRAIHLRVPADSWPAPGVPPSPREETPAEAPEIVTNAMTEKLPARPSHSGKTKFPAFARLFGRWTTGGGFHSRSELSADDSDLPNVPREIWASRVAIFALAAFFSFLAALAALKLHRCSPSVSRPSATAAAPAAPPPVASSTAPAVLPAPAVRAELPVAASPPPLAAAPVAPTATPAGAGRQTTDRPAMRAGSSSTRAAPGAAGKPRTPPTRPDPTKSSKGNADFLLPFGP
jgi:hypothetical protein